MLYLMLGVLIVGTALLVHMVLNLNFKTGEWKGRYKGKVFPL